MGERLPPVSRRDLIKGLRRFGYEGPEPGSRHETMRRSGDGRVLVLPNDHGSDIDRALLRRILKQAGITPAEWTAAK